MSGALWVPALVLFVVLAIMATLVGLIRLVIYLDDKRQERRREYAAVHVSVQAIRARQNGWPPASHSAYKQPGGPGRTSTRPLGVHPADTAAAPHHSTQ